MRQDFSTEIELFLRSVLLEDKSIMLLLSADYSFLNERMARLYGINNVFGPQFRRVTLTDPEPLWLAGQERSAAAHFLCEPHLAGAARRLGDGADHGHAAHPAAAGRVDQPGRAGGTESRPPCAPVSNCIARPSPAASAMA